MKTIQEILIEARLNMLDEANKKPEGGIEVDEIPKKFDKTIDHRWILPDGSWVDWDQTDYTLTKYTNDGKSKLLN